MKFPLNFAAPHTAVSLHDHQEDRAFFIPIQRIATGAFFLVIALATLSSGCKRKVVTTPAGSDAVGPAAPIVKTGKALPGYTLVQQLGKKTTDLVDVNGKVVHRWTSEYGLGGSAEVLENGDLIRCGLVRENPFGSTGNGRGGPPTPGLSGVVERLDWESEVLWTYRLAEPKRTIHHDIEVLPNGHILVTGVEIKTKEEMIEAGRDPARMRGETAWLDFLLEIKPVGPDGGETVWEWHLWDHLIQDFDPTKRNHGVVADHPELLDINFIEAAVPMGPGTMRVLQSLGYVGGGNPTPPRGPARKVPDWTHINAVAYNAKLDQVMVTARTISELLVIDHSTTSAEAATHAGGLGKRGGDVLYRWGNPQAYQRGTPADQQLYSPHDGHWISDGAPGAGDVLVFNNGEARREGGHSSVDQIPLAAFAGLYKIDEGKAYGPDKALWRYVGEPKEAFNSPYLSGAQRLANGNTLICSGMQGDVFEATAANEVVWRYKTKSVVTAPGMPPGSQGPPGARPPRGPGGGGPDGEDPRRPPRPPGMEGQDDGPDGPGEGGPRRRPPRPGMRPPGDGPPGGGPPGGGPPGRRQPGSGGLFRALRYALDYSAFANRKLEPLNVEPESAPGPPEPPAPPPPSAAGEGQPVESNDPAAQP